MCGIAGIIDYGGSFSPEALREAAIVMRDAMVHRGPDDAGVWVDPRGGCALAHRRLAIIDLRPEGKQPIANEDGSVHVTFNGEIYNFESLRDRLTSTGHRFRSCTDSEVLPHLFEAMDPAMVQQLDGMFAFAVWHAEQRKLILARDPFGKKPLYYATGPGWFAFASELHALARLPGFDAAIDRDALALYLHLQYVPHPWTIFRSARKLEPGSVLELDCSLDNAPVPRIERYFRFDAQQPLARDRLPDEAALEQLHALIRDAVRKRLVSDVPLGAFLSGGVDSSLVVAMIARELGRPIRTFSIGFADTDETEHHFAREIARHLGSEHHDELVSPHTLDLIHQIAQMLDEPNGDSSCLPTYLLSRYTRQHVTVALSGDGGDELFGGYNRYVDTLDESEKLTTRIRRSIRARRWFTPADGYLSPRWLMYQPEQVAHLTGGLSAVVQQVIAWWRSHLNDRSQPLMHRMRNLDAEYYMPGAVLAKVDRMSMQPSLEVRCPLLDRDVAAFASRLTADQCWRPGQTKRLLKMLASRYLPAQWMARRKMGFGLPANSWSRDEMLALMNDALDSPSTRLTGLLDREALAGLLNHQRAPGMFSIYQVWPLLILELWLRKVAAAPTAGPDNSAAATAEPGDSADDTSATATSRTVS